MAGVVPVVEVPDSQADLYEPAENLLFGEGGLGLLGGADALGEIASLCILHDYIEPALGCTVDLAESDDVRMA